MQSIAATRRIAVAFFLGGGMGFAQSTLPATSPTAAPAAIPVAAAKVGQPNAAQSGLPNPAQNGQQAQVTYLPGLLEVDADNSSLNQILRDISLRTGMKITGGVADERVYGKYGPAAPAEVLTSLLDGTNTNMILRETASSAPEELILTPREGGPTPPDGNRVTASYVAPPVAQRTPEDEDRSAEQGSPRPPYPGVEGTAGASPALSPPPRPQLTGPRFGPNSGAQTPQQIYQQLQQMQQTQQASPQQ
jgi:hypothetical protein